MTDHHLRFTKMQGLGNDFIVTHHLQPQTLANIHRLAPLICSRRTGIGSDGILYITDTTDPNSDFQMRMWNVDGTEAEMCGNGIRCVARYIQHYGLSNNTKQNIQTLAGVIKTTIEGNKIMVDMGQPAQSSPSLPYPKLNEPTLVGASKVNITTVSMGNPHAVIFVDALTDKMVYDIGEPLQSHTEFPDRTNVEFIQINTRDEITMRVYERGNGETVACGTGACASVVAGIMLGHLDNEVTVHLLGGDLEIRWDGDFESPVWMSGTASIVYEGSIDLSKMLILPASQD